MFVYMHRIEAVLPFEKVVRNEQAKILLDWIGSLFGIGQSRLFPDHREHTRSAEGFCICPTLLRFERAT